LQGRFLTHCNVLVCNYLVFLWLVNWGKVDTLINGLYFFLCGNLWFLWCLSLSSSSAILLFSKVNFVKHLLNMESLQCIGHLGVLSCRSIAGYTSWDKAQISGTPCIFWHHRYYVGHYYGDHCMRKGTRRAPNEVTWSTKCCCRVFFGWNRNWFISRNLEVFSIVKLVWAWL